MTAKVTCLYDEGALQSTSLIGAKGFSMIIDVDGIRLMFDTGMKGRYLLNNMISLDIDPDSIDQVIISRGHKEHTGGMNGLLKERSSSVKVLYPRSAEGVKGMFKTTGVYVDIENEGKAILDPIDDWKGISEHLFMSKPMDGGESFLVLITKDGPVVMASYSGCGVKFIMDSVKERFGRYPVAYMGGVLIGKSKSVAASVAAEFLEKGCSSLYLNHCTGVQGMMYLRVELGIGNVNDFYVGTEKTFDL